MAIEVGSPAPEIQLVDTDGNQFKLAEQRGKQVVVYFYPKDDTPGCTLEAKRFRDLISAFESANTIIVGVSPDDETSHDDFRCKYDLPFTLLCDTEKAVINEYGAWGEKVRDGKTSMGVIRSSVLIDTDGNVARHWAPVADAASHPDEVLEAAQGK